jgi:hypothetical protein
MGFVPGDGIRSWIISVTMQIQHAIAQIRPLHRQYFTPGMRDFASFNRLRSASGRHRFQGKARRVYLPDMDLAV